MFREHCNIRNVSSSSMEVKLKKDPIIKAFKEITFSKTSPIYKIENLTKKQDIDSLTLSDETMISRLSSSFLDNFPSLPLTRFKFFIKYVTDLYVSKGSEKSIKTFFKVLFDDPHVYIRYPINDVAKNDLGESYTSNDDGQFPINENNRFDSSLSVFQDRHYYQPFSYVITSSIYLKKWAQLFKKVIHPVGRKVYNRLILSSSILLNKLFWDRGSGILSYKDTDPTPRFYRHIELPAYYRNTSHPIEYPLYSFLRFFPRVKFPWAETKPKRTHIKKFYRSHIAWTLKINMGEKRLRSVGGDTSPIKLAKWKIQDPIQAWYWLTFGDLKLPPSANFRYMLGMESR